MTFLDIFIVVFLACGKSSANPIESESMKKTNSQKNGKTGEIKSIKNPGRIRALKIFFSAALVLALSFLSLSAFRTVRFFRPRELSSEEKNIYRNEINEYLDKEYEIRNGILKPLPYRTKPFSLDVRAESAICIDVLNGNIVYEKNADEVIPPASMTKLFLMYVVFEEIEKGNASLDDIVPLVPESWASNMPPHSSLMFLGKNQTVTLDELLTGLAVCSGNDASYAVAYYLSGGMEKFIEKMNRVASGLNLVNTHFVESSGYSEKNTTTAREMASFCREYLRRFPHSVKYHSALSFSYPKEKNLAPEDKGKPRFQDFSEGIPDNITMQITQNNTNPLLSVLKGCDGLKTGYIDESGYNLALTCRRDGIRFLSVTMKGKGSTTSEGQQGRVRDGTEIMEWAFRTFREYKNPLVLRSYVIPVFNAEYPRINLVPAYVPECLLVPSSLAENPGRAEEEVSVDVEFPDFIKGNVVRGEVYGKIKYSLGGTLLETVPLVAERDLEKSCWLFSAADFIAEIIYRART